MHSQLLFTRGAEVFVAIPTAKGTGIADLLYMT